MTKGRWLVVAAIVLVIGAAVVYFNNSTSSTSSSGGVSERDKALLLKGAKDPYVQHVRAVIDSYNSGKATGMSIPVDLGKYKEYLQGKFVLMQLNDAVGGGKDMLIAFTDKPDQFFYVWVYLQGDGSYDLRTFEPYKDIPPEKAKEIFDSSKPMVTELGLEI